MAREFYQDAQDKIEALIRIASAANSMEFGVKGHDFDNAHIRQGLCRYPSERT